MRRLLLVIATAACGGSDPPPNRPPVPPAAPARADRDPALESLARAVGPELRAVGRFDWTDVATNLAMGGVDPALLAQSEQKLAGCHASILRGRFAIGAPLRVAAELDGAIDHARLTCLFGPGIDVVFASAGLVATDTPGGMRITRDNLPGTPARELVDRCTGTRCLVTELGPRDHALSMVWTAESATRTLVRFHGLDLTALVPAVTATPDPRLAALGLRADRGDLVATFDLRTNLVGAATALKMLVVAFKIPSSSMVPTLFEGDHLFAGRGALAGPVRAGEVVVHRMDDREYVKRVIAVGGQTVTETLAGIEVDGVALRTEIVDPAYHFSEQAGPDGPPVDRVGALVREWSGDHSYLTVRTGPAPMLQSWTVPAGQYFVLGDNRNNSNDSRYQGPVPAAAIEGRVLGIWLAVRDGVPDWNRMGRAIE